MSKALNPPRGEVRSVPDLALGQSRGLTASLPCSPTDGGPATLLSSHFPGSGRSVVWPRLTCLSVLTCGVRLRLHRVTGCPLGMQVVLGLVGGVSQPEGLLCVLQTWSFHHPYHPEMTPNTAKFQSSL